MAIPPGPPVPPKAVCAQVAAPEPPDPEDAAPDLQDQDDAVLAARSALFRSAAKTEAVPADGMDDKVHLRRISGAQRQQLLDEYNALEKKDTASVNCVMAHLLSMAISTADGQPLFDDGDVDSVQKLPAVAIDDLVEHAQRINGMRDEDVEDAAKNSGSGQSAASGSG